jgi:hypothetical protein
MSEPGNLLAQGEGLAAMLLVEMLYKHLILSGSIPKDLALEYVDQAAIQAEGIQRAENTSLKERAQAARFHIERLNMSLRSFGHKGA